MLTQQTSSTRGALNPSTSEPITQQQSPVASKRITSTLLPGSLQHGEPPKQPVLEKPLPTADEIRASNPPQPRVFTLSAEEFHQWRQVLGVYTQTIQTLARSN